jgi:hypothetical protein
MVHEVQSHLVIKRILSDPCWPMRAMPTNDKEISHG